MLAGEFCFMKSLAAISTHVAIANEQFAVGQAGPEFERIDAMNAAGANDAVDLDDGLLSRDGIVTTVKNSNFLARFPADIFGCVIDHSLFQRNPRLRKPLAIQLKHLHKRLHPAVKP